MAGKPTLVPQVNQESVPDKNKLFSEFYDQYFDRIWKWLCKLGVRNEDAEDVCQEVLLVIYQKFDSFDSLNENNVQELVSLGYAISVNKSKNYRRHSSVSKTVIGQPPDLTDEQSDEALVRLMNQELVGNLALALRQLSEEHQVLIVLRYFDKKTTCQIAEHQNIPEGTVKTRLRIAKKLLKNSLEQYTGKEDNNE